jgi:Cof subfamily protein (haloacid dehalogenase superfamily)
MKNVLSTASHCSFRLAGIDLDDTLLDKNKRISPENFAAVRMLVSRGIKVIPTTGRIEQQTTPYYRELGLSGLIVTSDGASVRVPFRRRLQEVTLERSVSCDILQLASDLRITALCYYHSGIRITSKYDWNDNMDRHGRELGRFVSRGTVSRTGNRDLQKILVYCADLDRLNAFEQAVAIKHRDLVTAVRNPSTIEYTAAGVSKVSGLMAVCDYYSIDRSQVLFFGDGNNDACALSWAGCGVAMRHGTEAARHAARLIAPETDPGVNLAAAIAMVLEETSLRVIKP